MVSFIFFLSILDLKEFEKILISSVCWLCRNLVPDANFSTLSWIERIVIVGTSKPSKVTLKTASKCWTFEHLSFKFSQVKLAQVPDTLLDDLDIWFNKLWQFLIPLSQSVIHCARACALDFMWPWFPLFEFEWMVNQWSLHSPAINLTLLLNSAT